MGIFNAVREDRQKLWVQTPYPITHNVWAALVRQFFPKFSIDDSQLPSMNESTTFLLKNAREERWDDPKHRYLLRERNPDGSFKNCLTDGENYRWTHADLPDDNRSGLRQHDWGLIFIPNPAQTEYLEQIAGKFNNRGAWWSLSRSLDSIHKAEEETISRLLLRLKNFMGTNPKDYDELRRLVIGEYGDYDFMITYNPCHRRRLIERGKLPLTSRTPVNNIDGQTSLDFFRLFDQVISTVEDRTQNIGTSGIDYIMDAMYRPRMGRWTICDSLNSHEAYDPLARALSNFPF